jgi:tetratricopeptide (TPR) repeat protein
MLMRRVAVTLMRRVAVTFAAATFAMVLTGCLQGAIDANKQQLQDQQAQLDQLKQQVSALQSQRASYSSPAPPPGACDAAVMAAATRKGGERMAAGDATKALGYYQDAVTACPTSAEAQLNLANTYESIGDRAQAVRHYRIAADATGTGADARAVQRARQALGRMGASS